MIVNIQETMIVTVAVLAIALVIDSIFGELPLKIHPVVIIGKLIDFFIKYLIKINSRISGVLLTISVLVVVIILFSAILLLASYNIYLFIILSSTLLSSCFSIKFLINSASSIGNDLRNGIDIARTSLSYLVSRKTKDLTEELIISATIETLSENITDSVIAPVFYYLLSGIMFFLLFINFNIDFLNIEGLYFVIIFAILVAIIYRSINTLDAMVGYENEKYNKIGYFPAKIDDILNFIPARFGGILVVITSMIYRNKGFDWKNSYFIMKRDAKNTPSPNSGYTMAAVAGSLNVSLIKKDIYIIGDDNKTLKREKIVEAAELSKLAIILYILFLIIIFSLFYLFY